ncbi:glutamine amidotransferase [Ventosimonas gracilis]|uniref:Glutamine amidotransferase n=1 Tax=Ventosimonas gracilis TaxID=1680762 RepID=A0A139SRJ7_9GAMM|nr:type 1 glutamine amidotransferase [Ventosimonas gracilis]KXU37167.1 glutamine amidotransferase [Ventosimonas gracilis]
MKPSRALILTHAANDVLGSLPELLAEQGITVHVTDVFAPLPAPSSLDLLIVMGSPESAYDHRLPWLPKELAWLKEVQKHGVPTLGICFGSQILARVLGGECYRNHAPEIGCLEHQCLTDDWPHGGPWLDFHFDAFRVPPNATLLSTTDMAPQAYRHGRSLGVQFHPEITTPMYDSWINEWLTVEAGRRFHAQSGELLERIREQIQSNETRNRDNFRRLLGDFLQQAG